MVECPQTPSCDPEECKPVPDACVDNWVYPGWHRECDDAIGECISYTAEQPVDCTNSGLIASTGLRGADRPLRRRRRENTPPYCDGDFAAGNVLYSCNPDTGECEISSSEAPEDCTCSASSASTACVSRKTSAQVSSARAQRPAVMGTWRSAPWCKR